MAMSSQTPTMPDPVQDALNNNASADTLRSLAWAGAHCYQLYNSELDRRGPLYFDFVLWGLMQECVFGLSAIAERLGERWKLGAAQ